MTSQDKTAHPVASPTPLKHPWAMRWLRTVQFGLARLRRPNGHIEARAAPFDLRFTGPSADCITRGIFRSGVHEPAITRYLIEQVRLRAGEVALDVGANLGWYSVLFDRLCEPGAAVFAFEPDPATFALLRGNLERNATAHVRAINVALGEKPGTALLRRYKSSNNGRHSLLAGNSGAGAVEVPVLPLESFWHAQGLAERPLRILKVDVEGFEYFVLRGAGPLLQRCGCVLLEYSPASLSLTGEQPSALLDLLRGTRLRAQLFAGETLVPMSYARLAAIDSRCDLLLLPGETGG